MHQAQQIFDYAANQYATQPDIFGKNTPNMPSCAMVMPKGNGMRLLAKSVKLNLV